ncbi:solute carrier family 41 member 2-like [Tropilaelaps mercedesae]|uniref:Solute carrier family 41 member 2-like n=1 Tax=Tropilaelaps mercedesae TaxID=418985 RepID=A0A1V9XLE5_9ACAR|nr:solute carrier family 41 member 2-like [Tropilaelaps mercedesae]
MPVNSGYSPTTSEESVAVGCDSIINCDAMHNQGHYQSLGQTTALSPVVGSSSSESSLGCLTTISGKISEFRVANHHRATSKRQTGEEGMLATLIQVVGPFLVAGIGSMCTGLLLDVVKSWDNFTMIDTLITLVPTLLGLKGNLEMTVTARLCTAANLGVLDDPRVLGRFLRDDLLLTQFQATIVSLLASLLTLSIQAMKDPSNLSWSSCLIVVSSAVVTAAVACLFLGLLMTGVVALSRKMHINPDNVAAPLASSLGDISTLALFAYISLGMYSLRDHLYVPIALMCFLMVLCPLWGYLACQSAEVRAHLQHGWLPILLAMCISLGAGYILDAATTDLPQAPAYVPVVSGVCGNLLVILICRMTTVLRKNTILGHNDVTVAQIRSDNPFRVGDNHFESLTATFRLLLLLPILAHSIFLPIISFFTQEVSITAVYLFVFLSTVFVHALIMLFLTREMVLRLWTWGVDPDVASIPILTAVADLTGGAFTCAIFVTLSRLQDPSIMLPRQDVELFTPLVDPLTQSS